MNFAKQYLRHEDERIREFVREMIESDGTEISFCFDEFEETFEFREFEGVSLRDMLDIQLSFLSEIDAIRREMEGYVTKIASEVVDEIEVERMEQEDLHNEYYRSIAV